MNRILMVCLGNICRSPLAEGILKSKLTSNYFIDSCGTANYHVGDQPDVRSIDVAKKYGIDISSHIGRQFSVQDFDDFDVIYVMDSSNFQDVIKLATNNLQKNKVRLIMNELENSSQQFVPDPYYGTSKDFEFCYQLLDEVCGVIAKKLKSNIL